MIMDIVPDEADLPMPTPSSYGAFHEKTKIATSGNGLPTEEAIRDTKAVKKPVKYRECLKNHAASIGGHALDGCGEFMPSGEDGTMEALKCEACDCHRNFHRREIMEGETPRPAFADCNNPRKERNKGGPPLAFPSAPSLLPRSSSAVIVALNSRATEMDDLQDAPGFPNSSLQSKKRFRTKFSADQKERMSVFSEKLGWRIQRHDEEAVREFCNEVGVKRQVLKVWMHNNKNTFAKKPLPSSPTHLMASPPLSLSQKRLFYSRTIFI